MRSYPTVAYFLLAEEVNAGVEAWLCSAVVMMLKTFMSLNIGIW